MPYCTVSALPRTSSVKAFCSSHIFAIFLPTETTPTDYKGISKPCTQRVHAIPCAPKPHKYVDIKHLHFFFWSQRIQTGERELIGI